MWWQGVLVALFFFVLLGAGVARADVPEDFPRFEVPGQERPLQTLRRLFWLHYPGAGPRPHYGMSGCPAPRCGLPSIATAMPTLSASSGRKR